MIYGEHGEALFGISKAALEEAAWKERIVNDVEQLIFRGQAKGLKAEDVITTFLHLLARGGHRIAPSTLARWRKLFRERGLGGLIDRRGRGYSSTAEIESAHLKFFELFYYAIRTPEPWKAQRKDARIAYLIASERARLEGLTTPSLGDAMRWLYAPAVPAGEDRSGCNAASMDN
jgi:hypothetical protein